MQQLVYVTIMSWDDWWDKGEFTYQIHDTREKAQETLEKWKQEEYANSWIHDIDDFDELENFEDSLEYFDCCAMDKRITIWIEEKVIN